MDPLTLAAIGAALGAAKGQFIDKPNEMKQRQQQSEIMRYSPWTGMQAQNVASADPFGSMLQGGMTGAMLGQALKAPAPTTGASPYAGMNASQMGPYHGSMVA